VGDRLGSPFLISSAHGRVGDENDPSQSRQNPSSVPKPASSPDDTVRSSIIPLPAKPFPPRKLANAPCPPPPWVPPLFPPPAAIFFYVYGGCDTYWPMAQVAPRPWVSRCCVTSEILIRQVHRPTPRTSGRHRRGFAGMRSWASAAPLGRMVLSPRTGRGFITAFSRRPTATNLNQGPRPALGPFPGGEDRRRGVRRHLAGDSSFHSSTSTLYGPEPRCSGCSGPSEKKASSKKKKRGRPSGIMDPPCLAGPASWPAGS